MEESEKADSEPIPTNEDASSSQGKSCALCGCATPAVRCDRCNSQIFCLSCDDMYHRHPKRKLHLRKAVDSIWSSARSPRLRRRTDLPGDPCKIPIPPPRSKKRERHTIGGRIFLKSGLELGSFGHSKVFDAKSLTPNSKDFYTGQKSPASLVGSNCDDDTSSVNTRKEATQIYENDNVANQDRNLDSGNLNDQSPWNPSRPNISSPIQVSIPSSSPDIVNGQSFGYPAKPQSQSASDLSGHPSHAIGHHPYHFHPPYPYMHPPMHPYSHSMAHLNCAQCLSSSWSNLMSPHPSPYFHPMPWGSAQNTMSRGGQPLPNYAGPMKHSHGDLSSDSNFHYPYPGGGYYHNGPPVVDPNFIKDLHEHAEMQKLKKRAADFADSDSGLGNPGNPGNPNPGNLATPNPGNPGSPNPGNPQNPGSEDMDTTDETEIRGASPDIPRRRVIPKIDEAPEKPEKPTEPWTCIHCTYVNPPGSHICEVCCKTSYGKKSEPEEEMSEVRPMSRDSESPLVNRDALLNSPDVSGFKEAQKDDWQQIESEQVVSESKNISSEISEAALKLTTETQTSTTTKSTDVQTQNLMCKSIASSTDSIFPKQEISVQTEVEAIVPQNCSVATDPMISSQSLESLLSGVSAPPYHNRRAGWGRGTASFSTQSLYERGRSRSPMPRSHSFYTEAHGLGRDSSFASEEAMHSLSQAWLFSDPMYYKPHNQDIGRALSKEDYFDGTWGSMDKLNRRIKQKKENKLEHPRPKLHRSLDDLKSDKRSEMVHAPELLMLQIVKEAERCGFTIEDLRVAYLHCGKENPVYWLEDNWSSMIKNVIALAAKYGEDNEENDVGTITATEAKEALRIHHGDLWDAVTECIENRQRKILELTVRGNFTQKQIADALKNNEGNVELAYADLIRASTRRHKFILSPGLSEDSEDLNLYNPSEDITVDRHLSPLSHKLVKQDAPVESKTEKKKSDFLTKLSAIREAQSERRKAREEKELIRESITQDFPPAAESDVALKEKEDIVETPIEVKEDLEKIEEKYIVQDGVLQNITDTESKIEEVSDVNKDIINAKENSEDIPVDFGTNWGESQGEWIEEYSDEQWEEEGDTQWVGLNKKFQKMDKEFEEEAMQMAALWEKEELEDDVFEEEIKDTQPEAEVSDTQKKFDDWVKANLKIDSSEYEEEEAKEKVVHEDITDIPVKEDIEISHPSPLQHYPTEHDLSLTSQLDPDWVNLPADSEIEKLAHDIVCEGSDIENKFDEAEIISYEENRLKMSNEPEVSDEDWEKIELDEQLQEMNELDNFTFLDKDVSEVDKSIGEMDQSTAVIEEKTTESGFEITSDITSQVSVECDSNVTYKNIDIAAAVTTPVSETTGTDAEKAPDAAETLSEKVIATREKLSSEGDQPRPPVRRKSKLNSAAIEQALKNHAMIESASVSSDIPPALPEKTRSKEDQPNGTDVYAIPHKASKLDQQGPEDISLQSEALKTSAAPEKPPRLSLSPVSTPQGTLQREIEEEKELQMSLKAVPSKDASPVASFSNESDSNCFADSESDTEIKHRRQKYSRKLMKYENELEEVESISKRKTDKATLEKDDDFKLQSNFDFDDDDDIDPALIEPLPSMKSIDFDPELPILLGGRGSRLSEIDDIDAPKAFREDTTRPLQLFKAVKRETPTNTLNLTSSATSKTEDSVTDLDKFRNLEHPVDISRTLEPASLSGAPQEPTSNLDALHLGRTTNIEASETPVRMPDSSIYENQVTEQYYYNEAVAPQLSQVESQPYHISETYEKASPQVGLVTEEAEPEIEQDILPASQTEEEEINFMEMEGVSSAVDYFFGRYNEITVTPPKKKAPARAKPIVTTSSKSAVQSEAKNMSSSEIIPSKTDTPPPMEQSAIATLETPQPSSPVPPVESYIGDQQIEQQVAPVQEIDSALDNKVNEPMTDEYLPFAEDYLFGCYNQVIIPKKPKKRPVALPPIPKFGEISSLSQTSSLKREQKTLTTTPSPEPTLEKPEELEEPEVPESSEMIAPSASMESLDTSATYDEIFHDIPGEMLSNQSFDDSASIYYESFQDAVEDIQTTGPSVDSNIVNVRAKTVHFEEPEIPVVPPRKRKTQSTQKTPVEASSTSTETYADEYLFRQYGQYDERPQSKKKLPVCSEDFKMKQGLEPTKFPCDSPLMPEEMQTGILSSEISMESPLKSVDSSIYSPEYEFEVSEQSLDSVEYDDDKIKFLDASYSSMDLQKELHSEDSSVSTSVLGNTDIEMAIHEKEKDLQSSDIQSFEKAEDFVELSIPEPSAEITVSTLISSELNVSEQDTISTLIPSNVDESSNNKIQLARSYEQSGYHTSSPDRLEMDQFVFIEENQEIIDDAYDLYIQENLESSLANEYNYINIKGNIEDECSNDSELEWKLNEDRKNSLNANYINSASSKIITNDQPESIIEESGELNIEETKSVEFQLKTDKHSVDDENEIAEQREEIVESEECRENICGSTEMLKNANVEDENIPAELADIQPLSEFSEDAESAIDADGESKLFLKSDSNQENIENILTETAEGSLGTASEEVGEMPPQGTQESAEVIIEPLSVLCKKVANASNTLNTSDILSYSAMTLDDNLELSKDVSSPVKDLSDQANLLVDDFAVVESHSIDILEDFEASFELSDANDLSDDSVATHSSVSTQISVSSKQKLKELEIEDNLTSEQSEMLGDNNESISNNLKISSDISRKLPDEEESVQNIELGIESKDFEQSSLSPEEFSSSTDYISKIQECKDESHYLEQTYSSDTEKLLIESEKLSQTPPLGSEPSAILDSYDSEIGTEESVTVGREQNLTSESFEGEEGNISSELCVDTENEIQEFGIKNIESGLLDSFKHKADELDIEQESPSSPTAEENEDFCEIFSEDKESENIDLTEENVEEPLSVMSHFYDEWYSDVQPSSEFTLLSIDSIYAKYGTAESSESGNESDVDNSVIDAVSDNFHDNKILPQEETLVSQFSEYDIDITNHSYENLNDRYESDVLNLIDIEGKAAISDINIMENIEDDSSRIQGIHEEISLDSTQDDSKISESHYSTYSDSAFEENEVTLSTDSTATVTAKQESSDMPVKEEEISERNSVKNKFSTSKSCQTEDSFEEDIFFDSFDDTFTIPSYLCSPIEIQAKPPTSDISIQCELISIEDILSSKATSSLSEIDSAASEIQASISDAAKTSTVNGSRLTEREITPDKEKEESSSCESFEDTDSDIFIESHSSHDELDTDTGKRSFLHAEIDSDTGFSSGSECGWIQRSDMKQKQLGKGKKMYESSVTVSQSLHLSTSVASETKELSNIVESSITEYSHADSQQLEDRIIESIILVEKDVMEIKREISGMSQESEIPSSDESTFPPDIIERAITPVAIPQYPSFEEDLVFVEVEDSVEVLQEIASDEQIEFIPTVPTVEYFYGPLPQTVKIDSPPDVNERFFETSSELPETLAATKMSSAKLVSSESVDDESFADTFSSLKTESDINDSISEYYPLCDSSTSLTPRASISESDNFALAQSEFLDTSTHELLVQSDISVDVGKISVIDIKSEDKEDFIVAADNLAVEKSQVSDEKYVDHQSVEDAVKGSCSVAKSVEDETLAIETAVTEISTPIKIIKPEISSDVPVSNSKIPAEIDSKLFSDETEDKISPIKADTVGAPETITSEVVGKDLVANSSGESTRISKCEISSDTIEKYATSDKNQEETIPTLSTCSSDVPPVPSDIIRYLYYDDSVTFDDDSFHTQSENIDIPSLATDKSESVISDVSLTSGKDEEIDNIIAEKSQEKICATLSSPEESIEVNLSTPSTSEVPLSKISAEESAEIITEDIQVSDKNLPKKLTTSELETASEVLAKEIKSSEKDKESYTSLEPVYEPLQRETNLDQMIPESSMSEDIQFDEASASFKDVLEDVNKFPLRQMSTDVPHVPSDIVRYLYYDDDITFDDSSFHTHSELDVSALHTDELKCADLDVNASEEPRKDFPVTQTSPDSKKMDIKLLSEGDLVESSAHIIEHKQFETDSSENMETLPSFDNSESIDNWFDLEEDRSIPSTNGKRDKVLDSEQHSSSKSSALKDSGQPCIPEFILSPKLESDVPAAKADIDEVTDISTHFTMTDDSDKFSDIESDTSLNFEEECILTPEISDKSMEQIKFSEGSIEDEIAKFDVATPDIIDSDNTQPSKDYSPEQFLKDDIQISPSLEQQAEEILDECVTASEFSESVLRENLQPDESLEQEIVEKFDECITAEESLKHSLKEGIIKPITEQELKENYAESVTSSNLYEQPSKDKSRKLSSDASEHQLGEEFDEYMTTSEFTEQTSKEESDNFFPIDALQHKPGEKFDECITVSEFSEQPPKEENVISAEFSEQLPKEELSKDIFSDAFQQQPREIVDEHTTSEFLEHAPKEELDKLLTSDLLEEQFEEKFDECITASETSEQSKDLYTECITSSEISGKQSSEKVILSDIISQHSDQEMKQQSSECLVSNSKHLTEDENGNIPNFTDLISHVPGSSVTQLTSVLDTDKIHVCVEEQEVCFQTAVVSTSMSDDKSKHEDNDLSCYTSLNEDSHSLSTEVTDNWSDAECKNIDIDDSVYDLPLEEVDVVVISDGNAIEIHKEKIVLEDSTNKLVSTEIITSKPTETDDVVLKEEANLNIPVDLSVTESNKVGILSEVVSCESTKFDIKEVLTEPKVQEREISAIPTEDLFNEISGVKEKCLATESLKSVDDKEDLKISDDSVDNNENLVHADLKPKTITICEYSVKDEDEFMDAEYEKMEISAADDSYSTCQISETKETFEDAKSDLLTSDVVGICSVENKLEISSLLNISEQELKPPTNSGVLPPDSKNISDVKMESESEISTAREEIVNIECVSAVSGDEPKFSLGQTMYDTQEVECGSKELCVEENVSIKALEGLEESTLIAVEESVAKEAVHKTSEISDVKSEQPCVENIILVTEPSVKSDLFGSVDAAEGKKVLDENKSEEESLTESSQKHIELSIEAQADVTESLITVESLDVSDSFSSEYIANVTSEPVYLENTLPAVQKIIYEEPFIKEILQSEIQVGVEGISFDTETVVETVKDSSFIIEREAVESIDSRVINSVDSTLRVDDSSKIEEDILLYADKESLAEPDSEITTVSELSADSTETVIETTTADETMGLTLAHEPLYETSQFKDESDLSKEHLIKQTETAEVFETVDFKGCLSADSKTEIIEIKQDESISLDKEKKIYHIQTECRDDLEAQINSKIEFNKVSDTGKEQTDIADAKFGVVNDTEKKIILAVDDSRQKISPEYRGSESSEIIDFKGNIIIDENKNFQADDSNTIIEDKSALKYIKGTEFIEKDGGSIPEEKFDFKGNLNIKASIDSECQDNEVIDKTSDLSKSIVDTRVFDGKESSQVSEIVDFKGKFISQDTDTAKQKSVESTVPGFIKSNQLKLSKTDDSYIVQTVDFKGAFTFKSDKKADADIFKTELQFGDKTDVTVENETDFQPAVSMEYVDECGVGKYSENVDLNEEMFSYIRIIPQEQEPEFTSFSLDSAEIPYVSDAIYEQVIAEDFIERIGDSFRPYEQVNEIESPETISYMTADSTYYSISADESSQLLTCTEASTVDNSVQFYSLSDDGEDTLNTSTSEEFTDVPSHLTSTEESDKWSDVEGDLLLEDTEFDRDKTPTRTEDEKAINSEELPELKNIASKTDSAGKLENVDIKNEETNILDDSDLKISMRVATAEERLTYVSIENKVSPEKLKITDLSKIGDVKEIESDESKTEIIDISHAFEIKESSSLDTSVNRMKEGLKAEISKDTKESTDSSELILDAKVSTDSSASAESSEYVEIPSADQTKDITASSMDDFADLTSHHISIESDTESDVYTDLGGISTSEEKKVFDKVSEVNKSTMISAEDENKSEEYKILTEIPLIEHFADIKSLNEQLAVVDTFSSFDTENAISRMHEDTTISSQFEKTESDLYLEAATDHSVSEFEEEIVFSAEKYEIKNVVFADSKQVPEEIDIALPSSQLCTDVAYASTTSSSSYGDLEYSDHISDTCADISLQGTTTDNSDKLSDIEAEALIDDVLYGNVDLNENLELSDFPQPFKKLDKDGSLDDSNLPDIEFNIAEPVITVESVITGSTETSSYIIPKAQDKRKSIEEDKCTVESKVELPKSIELGSSSEGPDSSSANLTDSAQITLPSESTTSSLLSTTPSNITTALSDDELTNVTPLDVTTEESDKWSDISGDTSVEELDEESSISLKPSSKLDDTAKSVNVNISKTEDNSVIKDESVTADESVTVDFKGEIVSAHHEEKHEVVELKQKEDLYTYELEKTVTDKTDIDFVKLSDFTSSPIEDSNRVDFKGGISSHEEQDITMEIKQKKHSLIGSESEETVAVKVITDPEKLTKSTSHFAEESITVSFKGGDMDNLGDQTVQKKELKEIHESTDYFTSEGVRQDLVTEVESSESEISQANEKPVTFVKYSSGLESEIHSIDLEVIDQLKISKNVKDIEKEGAADFAISEEADEFSFTKLIDESETADSYTDVPTHTLTSETSDLYCDFESDHSVEDFESHHSKPGDNITPDFQETPDNIISPEYVDDRDSQSTSNISSQDMPEYCVENSLSPVQLMENVDEFSPDTIPENELENFETYSYENEHFEINEDELIYPLPYNDWIEQSFELKEYGIEAAFSESGSDIHGYGIANEEFDDEDIQRAIDFNISNFEEEENVGNTESFKTLSNDASPHLKVSEKEFDTWSTADAPSIEEDLIEHDDILSKIDELLAEDFVGLDNYEAESPPLEEDITEDDYFSKDVSVPDIQESEIKAETPKTDTLHAEDITLEDTLSKADKDSKETEFNTISDEISASKDSVEIRRESTSLVRAKNVIDLSEAFKEAEVAALSDQKPLSTAQSIDTSTTEKSLDETEVSVLIKDDSNRSISDDSEKCIQKAFVEESITSVIKEDASLAAESRLKSSTDIDQHKDVLSLSEEDFASVTVSSEEDNKFLIGQQVDESAVSVKSQKTPEKGSISSDIETDIKHQVIVDEGKDLISVSGEVSPASMLSQIDNELVKKHLQDEITLVLKDKQSTTDKEDRLCKDESTIESSVILNQKKQMIAIEEISASVTPSCDEHAEFIKKNLQDEITLVLKDKQSTTDKEDRLCKDESTIESSVILNQKKQMIAMEEISASVAPSCDEHAEYIKKQEDEHMLSLKEGITSDIETSAESNILIKKSKDFVSSTDEASASVALPSSTTLSSDEHDELIRKQDDKDTFSFKADESCSIQSSISVKQNKDILSSTDEASATIILPSDDIFFKTSPEDKSISSSEVTHTSLDIPSEKLAKSTELSAEPIVDEKQLIKSPESTEVVQSSQKLRKSSQSSLSTESSDSEFNIPDHKIVKGSVATKHSISETHTIISKEMSSSTDSIITEVKPDIPKKTKRKSIDLKEGTPQSDDLHKKPSLPPKMSKRKSSSETPSSSACESLSSSSSVESIGSFESAVSERSRKSSLKTADEASTHSASPEVPARRSRSLRLSSSSRSTSRDSDDSSRFSLKIRRRSSNFRDIEPIDLSRKRASIDERMLKLQNEGKCVTKEKAFIAAKLIEMQFDEEDALLASRQCNTVYHAVKFLTQLCELCNCRFPINLMASMVHCTHRACKECLKAHFTSLIYDRSIFTLLCPVCHKPDITDQNIQEYFNHLEMMLRNILEDKVYDLFQRKLRDEVLTKDPNFHWCSQCSNGFIASPRLKKLYCPDCSAITCAMCHQTWELEHEGVHCERFQQWKDMHTPEPPPAGLVKFLIDRGVSCPSCGLVYAQACGGCLMYKCSHCSFEFCGFCIRPCKRGKDCTTESCETRGLHIHHLHNCLFFVRDKDISEIQMLLEEESVTYLTIPPKDQIVKSRCQVREQKNIHGVVTEDRCGRDIEPYCGGLCRIHYYEYLTELLRKNDISPLSIMTIQDLQFMLRKSQIFVPEKVKGETSEEYYDRLLKLVSSALT